MSTELERSIRVTATMVAYYHICKRKLWLFARGLDFENITPTDSVIIGKLLSHSTYRRKSLKELSLGDAVIDFVEFKDQMIVHEVKKSPAFEEAHIWQVKYYIYLLRKGGFHSTAGVIHYPKQRRKIDVIYEERDDEAIEEALRNIRNVVTLPSPPPAVNKSYCRRCSYYEFCFI